MKRLLLLSALCMSMINASAQITTKNVVKKRVNPGFTNGWGLDKRYSFDMFDTSFSNFQQYHPLRRKLSFFQDLGDVGTPYKNLQFEVYSKPGFDLGLNPYNAYNFTHANSLYFNAPVPFTYFYYTQGRSGDERSMINFEAQHTQNINKNLNIAINYRSITNNSFYLRQKSSMKNLQATSLYTSKNKRYQAAVNLAWNKVITQESGGILKDSLSDSLFRNFPRIIRPVPVSLNNANNIVRYREHSIKQYYWFGGNKPDSFNKNYYPKFGLTHTFIMQKQAAYYTDQDKDRYFYDTLSNYQNYKTNDSLGMQLYSNRVGLIKQNYNFYGLYFNGGITYDYFKVYQGANAINFRKFNNYNLSADANFILDIKNKYLGGDANYFISGYNAGDYCLRGYLGASTFTSKYNFKTLISGNSQLKTPTRLETATLSNHYTWQNDFNKTFTN
ncbi:MAG: hypothetical protein H7321_09715, partial [Bacteroidia bacterium]|nr:hypothetical protein [Bacteroidia bacterium]